MSKLATFDVSQYLDNKEMIAEYLSQVLKDGDMNELLEAIDNDIFDKFQWLMGHFAKNEINIVKDTKNRTVIHTLRHTFASHLAINGTPIFTISKLMNHSDIKMTMRYAKLAPNSGKSAVDELYR